MIEVTEGYIVYLQSEGEDYYERDLFTTETEESAQMIVEELEKESDMGQGALYDYFSDDLSENIRFSYREIPHLRFV